jgi:hypothetical protein
LDVSDVRKQEPNRAAWKTPGIASQPKIVPVSTITNTPGNPIILPIRVGIPWGVITP